RSRGRRGRLGSWAGFLRRRGCLNLFQALVEVLQGDTDAELVFIEDSNCLKRHLKSVVHRDVSMKSRRRWGDHNLPVARQEFWKIRDVRRLACHPIDAGVPSSELGALALGDLLERPQLNRVVLAENGN